MKTKLLLLLALLFSALPAFPHTNVVIILADDMGYGDLGCYGQKKWKTPNIDKMAKEGTRLTDFYVPCPFCAPTRAALMTGRYQFRSGITGNPAPDAGINDIGISDDEITLGQAFQKAKYKTCCIGKWHLGHLPKFYPTRHGFDEYLGILYSADMRPVQVMDGNKTNEYPVVLANLTKKYTARATNFIERNKNKPFFLYFAQYLPHKPISASEDFYKKSGAGLYGDCIEELDRSVGEVFKKLHELHLDTNTLVFFASDNGPWYGGSTGGLRGMKGNTWEGGIREPLIAWWPGKIPAGRVSHEPAIIMDLFTTSLEACGVRVPQDRYIDGKNILPLLTENAPSPHEALFAMAGPRLACVRSGKWKLHVLAPKQPKPFKPGTKWIDPRAPDGVTILAPYEQPDPSQYPGVMTGDETKSMSLFDLEKDPAEQHDVAAQHPDVVEKLKAMFDEMNAQVPAPKEKPKKGKKKQHEA